MDIENVPISEYNEKVRIYEYKTKKEGNGMPYLNTILKRANLQALREYLMFGEQTEKNLEGYEERLSKAYSECLNIVKRYDCKGEESELFKSIINMTTEHENIYMELGIQAGFLLAKDIEKENQGNKVDNLLHNK